MGPLRQLVLPGPHAGAAPWWSSAASEFEVTEDTDFMATTAFPSRDDFAALLNESLGGEDESFEGKVHGTIVWPPRGEKGFGYDPIFVATGMDKTFAEIEPAEKHAISHRAEAFRKLVAALKA